MADADRQMALVAGSDRPEQAWILTDFDVWHANPYYSGPPVPHPEWDDGNGCPDSLHNPPIVRELDPNLVLPSGPSQSNDEDIPF